MGRCRSYRYLLQPTVPQRIRLEQLLRNQCELYNAALEERQGAWKWERRSVSYFEQTRTLTTLRESRPEVLAHGVTVCRGTLKRLDRAFAAFYHRCRAGQTPGFPRFKSSRRWDSVQWEDRNGWRLDTESRRLRLLGIGEVKVRFHRELRGTPKAITVAREGRRWWVALRCVDVPAQPLPGTGSQVGRYDLTVHEDLEITNMVRRPRPRKMADGTHQPNGARAKAGLNRSISDVGWVQLLKCIA